MLGNRLTCFYFFLILFTSATTFALAEPEQDWRLYKGAWFSIECPSDFTVRPSIKSRTSIKGCDSAFFISPDGLVEFYVFSPQWNGEPSDISINTETEDMISEKTDKHGANTVRWFTIGAKDKSYLRSYVDRENKAQNTRFVTGIKYPDQDVYNNYREIYLKFAKSLKQYAD
jgi:hypothetical protein